MNFNKAPPPNETAAPWTVATWANQVSSMGPVYKMVRMKYPTLKTAKGQ